MKIAALGVLAGVVAVAIWFSGDWPTEPAYGRTGQTLGGAPGDLIVLATSTLGTSTNGQFQQFLEGAEFENIEFIDITKNILPSSREIFKRGILGWPIYKLKRKDPIQINHAMGCIFQYLY